MKIASIVLIALGALLSVQGVLFKIQHWPDLFQSIISGPLMFASGFILLIVSVVRKRKAAD